MNIKKIITIGALCALPMTASLAQSEDATSSSGISYYCEVSILKTDIHQLKEKYNFFILKELVLSPKNKEGNMNIASNGDLYIFEHFTNIDKLPDDKDKDEPFYYISKQMDTVESCIEFQKSICDSHQIDCQNGVSPEASDDDEAPTDEEAPAEEAPAGASD